MATTNWQRFVRFGERLREVSLGGKIASVTVPNWIAGNQRLTAHFRVVGDESEGYAVERAIGGKPKYSAPGKAVAMTRASDGLIYVIGENPNGSRWIQSGSFRHMMAIPPNHRFYDVIGRLLHNGEACHIVNVNVSKPDGEVETWTRYVDATRYNYREALAVGADLVKSSITLPDGASVESVSVD